MSDILISQTETSIILAQGRATPPNKAWFVALGSLVVAAVLLIVLILLLAARIPLPQNTVALLSVQPRALADVWKPEEFAALPASWQAALKGKSRWPVILGAAREAGQWHAFALAPFWAIDGKTSAPKTGHGLVTWIGDRAPESDRSVRFTDQWRWRFRSGSAPFLAWIDVRALLDGAAPPDDLTPDGTFLVTWDGKQMKTTIPFSIAGSESPLKIADLSLNLPPGSTPRTPAERTLLERLPIGDQTLMNVDPHPEQVDLWLDKGQVTAVAMAYASPLSDEQALHFLGTLGFAERRRITLPDGTTAVERVSLAASGTSPFAEHRLDGQTGIVSLQPMLTVVDWTATANARSVEQATACHDGTPWARFSAQAVAAIVRGLELPPLPQALQRPLQAYASKGYLVFCQE